MSLMPDAAFLTLDPDLGAQRFTVNRRTRSWRGGRPYMEDTETLRPIGIIQPVGAEQLPTFPEGDRQSGMIMVHTKAELHISDAKDVSDEIVWQDSRYRIIRVDRWEQYGCYVAYGQKVV